jgi:hypothetical protein
MNKSDSNGFLTMALFASFMSSFATATVTLVIHTIIVVAGFLLLSTVGIFIFSIPTSKRLGYSTYMAAAIGLNCFPGFPYNYNLTNETVAITAENNAEKDFLTGEIMPKMIIGSVVAVTLVSCAIAGIFVKYL